jgi:polyisoprenoid-binding protein YceI
MKARTLLIAAAAAVILVVGGYIAINFIIPSIVTEVAVTGVPTARSSNLDDARNTATARALTAVSPTSTNTASGLAGIQSVAFVEAPLSRPAYQQAPLYQSCTADRGATATPQGAAMPTAEATAEPTMAATMAAPAGEGDFVFLKVVAEESEACFQIGEILNGNFVLAIGATKTITGEIAIDRANVANTQMGEEFVVNLAELQSDQRNRDRWIISQQGFNFNASPFAKLTEAKLVGLPARAYTEGEMLNFQIEGKLTIKEVTRDVVFTASAKFEGGTLVANAYYDTKLTDFGLNPPNLGFVRANDEFRIVLNLVAREG